MNAKSSRIVRKSAHEIPKPTAADLERLRRGRSRPVDTSDLPETSLSRNRVHRDAEGRLPNPRSLVRQAIVAEMERRGMSSYQVWRSAQQNCPSLARSAVYEFLKGQRQIGLNYIEAILRAMGLGVGPMAELPPRYRVRA